MTRKIELLAPAKNKEIGMEAIKHGADAVYIGASAFGARAAAGNTVQDIAELVKFAHLYGARVYVALNTVLKDEELVAAQTLAWDIYEAGADALILQDMGMLKMELPPIEIHASTQTDNRTVEKVKFLQDVGFSQVVLARELSLNQIHHIASQVQVPLEVFVHGALCVSYSGQCYLSESLSKRSANKGACGQYCRLPYDLEDGQGKVLARGKHLLSLKDLNQSAQLEQLLDAGVTSLKIEGRLKDLDYVKNIVGYYRQLLDKLFKKRVGFERASSGCVKLFFTPDPTKSFNRGFTNYYLLDERLHPVHNPDTPKSLGEEVGVVKEIRKGSFTVAGIVSLNNGDGLCFYNAEGRLEGFRVNKVEDNRVYPAEWPAIAPKMKLYRNYNHEFDKMLQKESAERKIAVALSLHNTASGILLQARDEDGYEVSLAHELPLELAKSSQEENQKKQLAKLGNTPFVAQSVEIMFDQSYFVPSSLLAELRRQVVELLEQERLAKYRFSRRKEVDQNVKYPVQQLTYLGNVTNAKAKAFYQDHGVQKLDWGFEVEPQHDQVLMFTKHCIKYAMGWCPLRQKGKQMPSEPLYLVYKETRLRLKFDCKVCEMHVLRD